MKSDKTVVILNIERDGEERIHNREGVPEFYGGGNERH